MECQKYISFFLFWTMMNVQILGVGDLLDKETISINP